MSLTRRSVLLLLATVAFLLGGPATVSLAVRSTLWQIDTAEQFEQGELEHVVLSSHGELKLGRATTRIALNDVALVWSVVTTTDGTTYLGTGNNGKVFRLRGAKVEIAAETKSLGVSALAVGPGGAIFAGTIPNGEIYRIPPGSKGPDQAKIFTTLEKADHVWALQYDSQRQVLFAATGPEGMVYSVDGTGRAEVYFDAEDDHLLSMLLESPGGPLIVGTSPKARVLEISGPGRAVALHDFAATEVKGIARQADGDLYLAVNTFPAPPSLPKTTSAESKVKSGQARPKPGKGKIFRRVPDGSVEPVLSFDEGHLTSVQALADGLVYAGTGAKGRVVAVGDDRVTYTIADIDERQVLALSLAGKNPLFVTGDTGAVYRVGKAASGIAEYRTPPIDSGFIAKWGRIEWRGEGKIQLHTRSGNSEEPDGTWSEWSPPIVGNEGLVTSPAGRYLQLRARWNRDPNAILRSLGVFYLRNNQRAVITKVEVDTPFTVVRPKVENAARAATNPSPKTSGKSASKSDQRSPVVKVEWEVDNPDHDRLRYRLFFRGEAEKSWRSILPSDRVQTGTSYNWNTGAVPAGYYIVKVEASDELDNPLTRAVKHEKVSPPVVIDNQPPRVVEIGAKARRVTGRVVDDFSPIAQIEYSLDGRQWTPVAPDDAIFDERSETFAFELPTSLSPGSYTVVVRGVDRAQNDASGRVLVELR